MLILFTRKTCPNCRMAERLLDMAEVKYENLVADDHMDKVRAYGITSAPALVITGENGQADIYAGVPAVKRYIKENK